MKIAIRYRPPMRLWQHRLAEGLAAAGHRVWCVASAAPRTLPFAAGPALALERRLFGPKPSLFDTITAPREATDDTAELVITLDGESSAAACVLTPLFDGGAGDAALLAMLTRGTTPNVQVRIIEDGLAAALVSAHLAVEDRMVLSRALDHALARVVSLMLQAVRRLVAGTPRDKPLGLALEPGLSPLPSMARGLARKVAGRRPGARRGPNHWQIAYRWLAGPGVADDRVWPLQPYTILPADGARFHADPMPFEHDGRTYLFFEDFPYATGKGVIGLVDIAADGTASPPRTVLEQPWHLSYPLIIPHDGEIYMLPEMSAAGRVQLFRADPFPDRWVPDRVLLDDVVAADATPIRHEGLWWLFATLSHDGGSTWDQLGLFHAPDLLGPWTAHADNPVLVDAGAGRPAGPMWHENGALMRVAQDCRSGYGVGLAICRVDRLTPDTYGQTLLARLGPPTGYGSEGVSYAGPRPAALRSSIFGILPARELIAHRDMVEDRHERHAADRVADQRREEEAGEIVPEC